jgi:hypothetical protein
MAQIPCEASLRPDWLTTSFRSATADHMNRVFALAQDIAASVPGQAGFQECSPGRHFSVGYSSGVGVSFMATPPATGLHNQGVSVIHLQGTFWAHANSELQMRTLEELAEFEGRYRFTRLDAQVTTLEPEHTAEQVLEDVAAGRLWIKGYNSWKPDGVRDIDGQPCNGVTVYFGAPSSDKRVRTYNKAAEQGWDIPARRDEVQLRQDWANTHTQLIAQAIAGAKTPEAAYLAYQQACSALIAQHMQYLDITGVARPRPKNWARGRQAPKWWRDTLSQEFEPVLLSRRVTDDLEEKMNHLVSQYGRIGAAWMAKRVLEGKSDSFAQASYDFALRMLQKLSNEDLEELVRDLPKDQQRAFMKAAQGSADLGASHSEMTA